MMAPSIAPFPARIVLELTPLCNLACPVCPRHHSRIPEVFMDVSLFDSLLAEIQEANPRAVILPFWRGESCLHPEFETLMHQALDCGFAVHLSTNGHFMTPDVMDVFYRCEFITFSLHTPTGLANARKLIAGKPAWSQTVIQGSFVDREPLTRSHLPACIADRQLKGFDSIRLFVEHSRGGQFGRSARPPAGPRRFCPKLTDTLVVAADGSISRCNHIWQTEAPPAGATLRDIWHGPVLQQIRDGYPDERCRVCDQWGGHTCGELWRRDADGNVTHVRYE